VNTAAVVFLAVSCISLAVHATALVAILTTTTWGQIADLANRGLIRTAASRTAVAIAKVTLGTYAVTSLAASGPITVALVVFCLVEMTWLTNALLDVRLKRRIAKAAQAREDAVSPTRRESTCG
jgi:hypothetical protein